MNIVISTQTQKDCLHIAGLTGKYCRKWHNSDEQTLPLCRKYTAREQANNEKKYEKSLVKLIDQVRKAKESERKIEEFYSPVIHRFTSLLKIVLPGNNKNLDLLLSNKFDSIGSEFYKKARQFDQHLETGDIMQASRNVWTMTALQILFDIPVKLTSSVFAYSLLYPYSDNFLDDINIPSETKQQFNTRLTKRLSGRDVKPSNNHEKKIWKLLNMIEQQYRQTHYPEVHQSLLAIHQAQIKSLKLLKSDFIPEEDENLEISIEKGGTSVLADGYLVAGHLDNHQQDFLFGYGAFLQLIDDLQDMEKDQELNLNTMCVKTSEIETLDRFTTKLLNFGYEILEKINNIDFHHKEDLQELISASTIFLIIEAASCANRFYSINYLEQLEKYSPLRLKYLKTRRKRFKYHFNHLIELLKN